MKFFSINKNQAAILTTLLFLISLGACYFFVYLPNNEKHIQEQRFSALQHIDRNIHTKIENSVGLLNNLLGGYQSSSDTQRQKLISYITSYSSDKFTLTLPTVFTIPKQKDSLNTDSSYTIKVNNDTREISLFFSRLHSGEKEDTIYKMGMKFSFSQFVSTLLPKNVFDQYIIFSKDKPVYESFPAGVSYVIKDSLLGIKSGIGSAGIKTQVISGTEYKIFLQPVGFDANNEWIIGGLLSSKNYQNEKTQLPTQTILLLVTVMLIGMVAFPWLKLYQMGSRDRLTISDGIASIFISMLLVSLIFFVFFNYNFRFRPLVNTNPRTSLANGIDSAFKNEIDTVYHKLQQFDNLVTASSGDMVNINKKPVSSDKIDSSKINAAYAITRGIDINQVFWLNKNGSEIINWTADRMNAPHGNFESRQYFKQIADHREYLKDGDARYFLEQVVSWTSATFRTVMSVKSRLSSRDSLVVAALSFNFKSLDNVVLPAGFLFAVTDNAGNVLYHSESSRNLNENLLDVFSKSYNLKSCLDAKTPGTFTTKYWGHDYEVMVKPINGLPYFIVIFEDAVYNETSEMEIYGFTFSMMLFFFCFLVLQLFAIFLVSAKRSFFKKQLLDTSWIGPKASNHSEYILSSVFNTCIIFLLMLFFKYTTFLEYIFILLLSVTFIPLFLNIVFAQKYFGEKAHNLQFKLLAKYCLWGFIIIIAVSALKCLSFHHFLFLTGYAFLILFLGAGIYALRERIYDIAHRLKRSRRCNLLYGRWNYIDSFALMACTRLIVTSGLPVIFFYIGSYNYEQNVSIRYKQVDFANRLVNKYPQTTTDDISDGRNKWSGVYYDSSLIHSFSIVTKMKATSDPGVRPYSSEELRTVQLLKLFHLYMTGEAITEDRFYTAGPDDSSFFFNHLLKEACAKGTGTITYRRSVLPGRYLKIQSENLNYHYPAVFGSNWFNGIIFWLLLAGMLFLFYFTIRSIIKKLFALNLPDLDVWKRLDNEILINRSWDQPLFVIGLPGAGKKKYLLDKIRSGDMIMNEKTPLFFDHVDEKKNNVFIAELINIPSSGNEQDEKVTWNEYTKQVFDEKNRVIIVNHFEYNIQDSVSNRFKLEFLERLYLENKCKIIILSTIHPVAFLDSAMDESFKPEEKSVPGQDLERWHVLLGHYRIVILPLQLSLINPDLPVFRGSIIHAEGRKGIMDVSIKIKGSSIETFSGQSGEFILPAYPLPFTLMASLEGYYSREVNIAGNDSLDGIVLAESPSYMSSQLVRQETGNTYFLKKLQGPVFEAGSSLTEATRIIKFDELAFKLQVSSHYFYMYIWQSLTKEEKFLLYDLAEDNLVNSVDDYNLSMLIAKGVVIRPDGTLKLFNKSFRNFILTAIGNSEAIKIKNRIKENGNWNTLKNPLQLIILAILAFLLTSQEEAFAKLITYVAALGAAVPAVLKLFSFFDKNSQKPG